MKSILAGKAPAGDDDKGEGSKGRVLKETDKKKKTSKAPATPTRRKRKAAIEAEVGGSAKKKARVARKSKSLVPERVDAEPKKGPGGFDAGMYRTPLDEAVVLGMADKDAVLEMFARVREVRSRVRYDFETLRKNLVKKDWWAADDLAEGLPYDSESEDSVEDLLSSVGDDDEDYE